MISVDELIEYLKADEADEALIEEFELAAVAIMQNETGRYFGPFAEITEVLSGNGWAPIWLQADPVIDEDYDPFELELRSYPNGDWSFLTSGTDFEVDGGRIYPLVYWTPGRRTLRATYWAGYEPGEEPADVRQAVRELVARMFEHRKPFVVGTTVAELPFSVQQTIRAHRIPAF